MLLPQNGLVREVMVQERFWNLVQYPKRVVCLSSDHVECTSSRSSKRLIAATVQCAAIFVNKKSRLQRRERATVLVFRLGRRTNS